MMVQQDTETVESCVHLDYQLSVYVHTTAEILEQFG